MVLERNSLVTQKMTREIRVIGCIAYLSQSSLSVNTDSMKVENNSMLTHIGPDAFDGLKRIGSLSLKNNSLEGIDQNAFWYDPFSRLKRLDLSQNSLGNTYKFCKQPYGEARQR